jgi:hypothetical protein
VIDDLCRELGSWGVKSKRGFREPPRSRSAIQTERNSSARGIALAVAYVHNYTQLMDALRERVSELKITLETAHSITGLQSGYSAKLLAPVPLRALGRVSLGPLLTCLGLKLVVVEDLDAFKRIESRLTKRRRPLRDASDMLATKKWQRSRFPGGPEFASFMNARRTFKLDPSERSAIARTAANARWQKVRAVGDPK